MIGGKGKDNVVEDNINDDKQEKENNNNNNNNNLVPMTYENMNKWNKSRKIAKRTVRDSLAVMPIFGLIKKVDRIENRNKKQKRSNNQNNNNNYNHGKTNRIIKVRDKLKLSLNDLNKTSRRIIRRQ